ncbi:hypothetical protein EfmAA242_06250 [Enterococcus faecium]|nr:hypothetical protein EfmAA242_06250 [Enterococcus faecium]
MYKFVYTYTKTTNRQKSKTTLVMEEEDINIKRIYSKISVLYDANNEDGRKLFQDSANKADDTTLKVGASPTPHAEILEHVKPLLKDEGIDLEMVNYLFSFQVLP